MTSQLESLLFDCIRGVYVVVGAGSGKEASSVAKSSYCFQMFIGRCHVCFGCTAQLICFFI